MFSDSLFSFAKVSVQDSVCITPISSHEDPFYIKDPKSIRLSPPSKDYPAVFEFQYYENGKQVLVIRVLRINIANLTSKTAPIQYSIQGLKLFYELSPAYNIETTFENETSINNFFKEIHNKLETLLDAENIKFNVTSYSASSPYWCQYGSSSVDLEEVCRRFVHQYNPPLLYLHFSGRNPRDVSKLIKNTGAKLLTDIEKEERAFLRKYHSDETPSC